MSETTDRELLMLAARAAGISGPIGEMIGGGLYVANKDVPLGMWAPQSDDGDALRLATKLSLCVSIYNGAGIVTAGHVLWASERYLSEHFDKSATEADICAAARRATVRAAASLAPKEDAHD